MIYTVAHHQGEIKMFGFTYASCCLSLYAVNSLWVKWVEAWRQTLLTYVVGIYIEEHSHGALLDHALQFLHAFFSPAN